MLHQRWHKRQRLPVSRLQGTSNDCSCRHAWQVLPRISVPVSGHAIPTMLVGWRCKVPHASAAAAGMRTGAAARPRTARRVVCGARDGEEERAWAWRLAGSASDVTWRASACRGRCSFAFLGRGGGAGSSVKELAAVSNRRGRSDDCPPSRQPPPRLPTSAWHETCVADVARS
eukprot:362979-Chlamydomonas_euryale.AAC.1